MHNNNNLSHNNNCQPNGDCSRTLNATSDWQPIVVVCHLSPPSP